MLTAAGAAHSGARQDCYSEAMAAGSGADPGAALGRDALAYVDALHNLARYLTGNSAAAEDLVQETYVRALSSADQFAPGTTVGHLRGHRSNNSEWSPYPTRLPGQKLFGCHQWP